MWTMLIQCCWLPRVSVSCLLQPGACLEVLPRNSSEPFQLLTRNRSEPFQHVFAANQGNEQLVPEPFWTFLNRSAANSATEPFWTVPHLPWTDCLEPFWTVPAWHLQSVTFKPSLVMLKLSCTSVYILCMCKVYQIHIYVYIYIHISYFFKCTSKSTIYIYHRCTQFADDGYWPTSPLAHVYVLQRWVCTPERFRIQFRLRWCLWRQTVPSHCLMWCVHHVTWLGSKWNE